MSLNAFTHATSAVFGKSRKHHLPTKRAQMMAAANRSNAAGMPRRLLKRIRSLPKPANHLCVLSTTQLFAALNSSSRNPAGNDLLATWNAAGVWGKLHQAMLWRLHESDQID